MVHDTTISLGIKRRKLVIRFKIFRYYILPLINTPIFVRNISQRMWTEMHFQPSKLIKVIFQEQHTFLLLENYFYQHELVILLIQNVRISRQVIMNHLSLKNPLLMRSIHDKESKFSINIFLLKFFCTTYNMNGRRVVLNKQLLIKHSFLFLFFMNYKCITNR